MIKFFLIQEISEKDIFHLRNMWKNIKGVVTSQDTVDGGGGTSTVFEIGS